MASFGVSQYGKFVSLQNNSGSADATAPLGGVYLFASGAAGSARLYMQNEGGTITDLAKSLDIDAFSALGGTGLAQSDNFVFSDGGTEKKVTFSNLEDAIFGNVSGDATIAAGGALTLANDSVESGMLNDNVISGQTELAHADIASADELMISDGGTLKKVGLDSLRDHYYGQVSGDATIADGGALTIGAGTVHHGMLNDDIISGQANLGGTGVDDADEFMFSDAGTVKALTGANLYGWVFSKVSGDATVAAGGALTIANDAVEQAMIADDAVGADQLAASAVVNASVVDGSIKADKLDLDGSTDIGADLVDADLMIVDDGAGGTNRVAALSRIKKYVFSALSGDATASDSGALTIAAQSVENSMLADDAVGADELAANAVVNASIASNAAIDMDKLDGGSLASSLSDLAQGDLLYAGDIDDSNNLKSITFSNLEDAIFGNVSGDATIAAGGVLTIAAQAVENSMLADDAVGADELAANAVVNASVASNAAIAATKIDFNVDFGGNIQFGDQANDTVAFGGPIKLGGNAIANSQGESTITMDVDQNVSVAAGLTVTSAMTVGGGYGSSGVSVTAAGAISADGALTIGADGAGVNFKAFGGAANEHMSYDAGNHVLYFADGSGNTILTLGGDATSEYALDVANGANNQNKVRAAAFVTYSDESLKSDVATMNTALDTVMSLNGVEFTWNDSGERDFGFIAQDVQNVLPQAVHVAADGVQGVDYSRLTSVLVEAVKAQQVQIEELKTLLKK